MAVMQSQIMELLADKMDVQVPSVEVDLFQEGLLDSLTYVRLIVELQKAFDVSLSLGQINLDEFKTIEQISSYVRKLQETGVTA